MQETSKMLEGPRTEILREFFREENEKNLEKAMDDRLKELTVQGHTLVKRVKIGRNADCPCGSGKKFKKCCISKLGNY